MVVRETEQLRQAPERESILRLLSSGALGDVSEVDSDEVKAIRLAFHDGAQGIHRLLKDFMSNVVGPLWGVEQIREESDPAGGTYLGNDGKVLFVGSRSTDFLERRREGRLDQPAQVTMSGAWRTSSKLLVGTAVHTVTELEGGKLEIVEQNRGYSLAERGGRLLGPIVYFSKLHGRVLQATGSTTSWRELCQVFPHHEFKAVVVRNGDTGEKRLEVRRQVITEEMLQQLEG